MKNLIRIFAVVLTLALALSLCSCGKKAESPTDTASTPAEPAVSVRIATLSGPTGMGMAPMMSQTMFERGNAQYNFTVETDPQALTAAMINKSFDIAALPVNVASVLYKKTNGQIKIAAVNTLGNLFIISNDETIKTISDLKGKTIVSAGQGATPEYILRYLLKQNGIDDVTIEFKSEHAEVSTLLASGKADIGLLPEPSATATIAKNNALKKALNLNTLWNDVRSDNELLTQGCIVVSTEFAQNNKAVLDRFLTEYSASIEFTNQTPANAAKFIVENKIFAAEAVAQKSIKDSAICYIDGDEMKNAVNSYLKVLFDADPKAVGGSLPDDQFFYKK